jgi:GcrA cell cycle regulator
MTGQITTVWPQEKIDRLCALTASGLTAGECGIQLGITRNAVIGKWHRLGIGKPRVKKPKLEKLKRRQWTSPTRNKATAWLLAAHEAPPTESRPANPVALMDLQRHHCRWPFHADDGQMLYCGERAHERLPYCDRHCRMAYTMAPSREESKAAIQLIRRSKLDRYIAARKAAA